MANAIQVIPHFPKRPNAPQEEEEWYGLLQRIIRTFSISVASPSLGAQTGGDTTTTVVGLSTQDFVWGGVTTNLLDGYAIQNMYVSAKNTLVIQWFNADNTTHAPGTITVQGCAIKTIT